MRNALVDAIGDLIKKDKNIYLLTWDLGWGVFDTLLQEFPDQCINVGISEQNMIGIAAGLALEWKKVYCYSIVPFIIMRAYEQIRVDICSHNLDVTLIWVGGGMAYWTLWNTHYGLEDINLMRGLPNMRIFCPVDKIEMMKWFDYLREYSGPKYIRLNRWWESNILESIDGANISKWIPLLSYGNKIILFSTWRIWAVAKEVAERFKNEGYEISLYSIPVIKPIDTLSILSYIKDSSFVFTIEEHTIFGWLWSTIAEIIAESTLYPKFKRIGIQDRFFYTVGDQDYMRKEAGIDAESIYNIMKWNL